MRKSKFTDAQVVAILQRSDRDPMAVVAQRHGVSEQTNLLLVPSLGAPAQPVRQDMHLRYFPQLASNGPAGVCTCKGRVNVCVCRSLEYQMPLQRLYIYRCGTTNACALTGEKGDPRLPAPLAPDRWRFWMQTGCQQTDNAPYDFALETAMTQIAARGYYLFTGSTRLLEARTVARPAIPKLSIISDVPFVRQ
jgi:hypothetical protein